MANRTGPRILRIVGIQRAWASAKRTGPEDVVLVGDLLAGIPDPPPTGAVVLTSTNGVLSWQPAA